MASLPECLQLERLSVPGLGQVMEQRELSHIIAQV